MQTETEKKFYRFTVRCTKKLKRIITEETAKHNSLGGNQITQTDMVNELLTEALVSRGLLRRDQESH